MRSKKRTRSKAKKLQVTKETILAFVVAALALLILTIVPQIPQRNSFVKRALSGLTLIGAKTSNNTPLLTVRERFGFGFPTQTCAAGNLECFFKKDNEYYNLKAGWYTDWSPGWAKDSRSLGGPRDGNGYPLAYIPLVGAYGEEKDLRPPVDPDVTSCATSTNSLLTEFRTNETKFPDGTIFSVGNEIGWFDDDDRTPETYAFHFSKWYKCLKQINPTFQVGMGAVLLYTQLPRKDSTHNCVSKDYRGTREDGENTTSGNIYFTTVIDELKKNNGNSTLPDVVFGHLYTPCNPEYSGTGVDTGANKPDNSKNTDYFQTYLQEYRRLMSEAGLNTRQLIIKEFGVLNQNAWGTVSDPNNSTLQTYLREYMADTIDILFTTKDTTTGNPNDEYRLAQRWAWFVFADYPSGSSQIYKHLALFDSNTKNQKTLGKHYQELIEQYANLQDVATPTPYAGMCEGTRPQPVAISPCNASGAYCFAIPSTITNPSCNTNMTGQGGPNLVGYFSRTASSGMSCTGNDVCCYPSQPAIPYIQCTISPTPTPIPPAGGDSHSMTLTDVDDTYISSWDQTTSYGNGANTSVRPDVQRTLIRFDLSALSTLPPNTAITKVTLRLYPTASSNNNQISLAVKRLLVPWSEQATWLERSPGVPWGRAGALATTDVDTDVVISGAVRLATWQEIDVTALSESWFSGSANNGVIIDALSDGKVSYSFAASEHANPSNRPQLVVTYSR